MKDESFFDSESSNEIISKPYTVRSKQKQKYEAELAFIKRVLLTTHVEVPSSISLTFSMFSICLQLRNSGVSRVNYNHNNQT